MAYLNEFPHVEANKLNLDWLLEQYSTFNKRLKELHDHFDEAVATFETELESFKHDYEEEFLSFTNEINSTVNDISDKVDRIDSNIGDYVENYLEENIQKILVNNPVLETTFTKFGYIDTNETATLELETDKLYEIMTIDYALNMHKGIAVNNACKLTQCPFISGEFVADVSLTGSGEPSDPYELNVNKGYALSDETSISLSSTNNVLTVTNTGTNRVRVYYRIIGEL